jgi:hypothetical protein
VEDVAVNLAEYIDRRHWGQRQVGEDADLEGDDEHDHRHYGTYRFEIDEERARKALKKITGTRYAVWGEEEPPLDVEEEAQAVSDGASAGTSS